MKSKALLAGGLVSVVAFQAWRMLGGISSRSALPIREHVPANQTPANDTSANHAPATAIGRNSTLVVFLTSDSGYLALNRELPRALAEAGYPTLAWNSLRYYLKRREPEEAASDLERLLDIYFNLWGVERWAAVGYSFGAGVLPFLLNRLPEHRLATLSSVTYLAYPGFASFRFKPSGWLLRPDADSIPATEEVAKLPRVPSICIAGESDPIRDCRSIEKFGVRRSLLPLGHGLHPELPKILSLVLETLDEGVAGNSLG